MQSENKSHKHWKDKLDETGSSLYSPASKELAWQKLNGRLGEKKRRKTAVWYWAAAACLLPLLWFLLMFRDAPQQPAITTNIPHKPSVIKPPAQIKPQQKDVVIERSSQSPVVKKTAHEEVKQKNEIATVAPKEIQSPVDSVISNQTIAVGVPADSNTNIASIAQPQKKKLKVVHINELNEPDPSVPMMAHNNYPKFLPLQLAKEAIYPEPVKAVSQTGLVNFRKKSIN